MGSEIDPNDIWDFAKQRTYMVTRQIAQNRLKMARIVNPPDYSPQEVWMLWETHEARQLRQSFPSLGFLSDNKKFYQISKDFVHDWRYFTYTLTDDCELVAYISESIELGHPQDAIQVESFKYKKAIFNVALERDEHHGAIYVTGPNAHFKFSPGSNNRKLLYFARPRLDQKKTHNNLQRLFVIGIYDFESRGVVLITDESICTKRINAVEWTPDGRGMVFHRDGDLLWYRFGDKYMNVLFKDCPIVIRITFSPGNGRLAVFLPTCQDMDSQILLFHWPLVKAAVTYQHEVISLGDHRVWSVPDRPWANGGKDLIFNANWQHNVVSYVLTTETCDLQKITFPKPAVIVDVQEHEVLFETTAANSHSRVWYTSLSAMNGERKEFSASLLATSRDCEDDYENEFKHFEIKNLYFGKNANTGVLYMPPDTIKPGKKLELVVIPHAGVKPNFTALDRDPTYSSIVNCAFCVLVVNNRVPTAQLEDGYPDKVDLNFADDVHNAVVETLEMFKDRLDPESICLYGADYASFIVSSLIVKHPIFYKSATLIRPHVDFPLHCEMTEDERNYLKEWTAFEQPAKVRLPVLLMVEEEDGCDEFRESLLKNGVICYKEVVKEDDIQPFFIQRIIDFLEDPIGEELAAEAGKMLEKLNVSSGSS